MNLHDHVFDLGIISQGVNAHVATIFFGGGGLLNPDQRTVDPGFVTGAVFNVDP